MSDSKSRWTKEEFIAHVARKRQSQLEELRKAQPAQYAKIMELQKTGKKPTTISVIVIFIAMFGGMIARYLPEIKAELLGN